MQVVHFGRQAVSFSQNNVCRHDKFHFDGQVSLVGRLGVNGAVASGMTESTGTTLASDQFRSASSEVDSSVSYCERLLMALHVISVCAEDFAGYRHASAT